MTVRIRTALLMLVLSVLLPAAVAAAWLIAQTDRSERQAVERSLRDSTRALSSVVDRMLDQRTQVTRVLSAARALDDGLPMSESRRREFDADARAALGEMAGWVTLDAADEHLVDTRWPPDAQARPRSPQGPPLVDRITIGAQEGRSGEHASALHAAVVQPVVHGGRVVFNVTLSILPSELQQLVERQAVPPGWVSRVLDARGRLVAQHPAGAAVVGRAADDPLLALVPADHPIALDGGPVRAGRLVREPFLEVTLVSDPVFAAAWYLHDLRDDQCPAPVMSRATTSEEWLAEVSLGRGVDVVPESVAQDYVRPGLAFVPIADLPPSRLVLAWDPARISEAGRRFVRYVQRRSTAESRE